MFLAENPDFQEKTNLMILTISFNLFFDTDFKMQMQDALMWSDNRHWARNFKGRSLNYIW